VKAVRLIPLILVVLIFIETCSTGKKPEPKLSENVVVTTGEAPIYQDDRALARNRALRDAKVNAIRKIIGEQITQRSGVADGQALGVSLYSKTDAFVKQHEILGEERFQIDTQPMLRLTVRCEIEPTRISTAVDALLDDIGNPRMAILVAGEIAGQKLVMGDPRNQAEAELAEALRGRGNTIVSSARIASFLKARPSLRNLNPEELDSGKPFLDFAQEAGADVLLIGSISSKDQGKVTLPSGKQMDIMSSAVSGSYKMIQLWGDGRVFGSGSAEGRGADLTLPVAREKAIQDWAKLVGQKAGRQIKDEWFRLLEENTILLKFTGLPAQEAIAFRDDLLEFTSVKRINERISSEMGSEWELVYPGKESMFSEELLYKKDRGFRYLSRYRMKIVKSARGEVVLAFDRN